MHLTMSIKCYMSIEITLYVILEMYAILCNASFSTSLLIDGLFKQEFDVSPTSYNWLATH